MKASWLSWTARVVSLLWAGWWAFFAFAGAAADGGWLRAALPGGIVALLFFGSAVFAWLREHPGAILLMLEGLLFGAAYSFAFLHARTTHEAVFVLTTLALPPFVSGLLFYGDWWRTIDHRAA